VTTGQVAESPRRVGPLAVLHDPGVRLLWTARTVSSLGDSMALVSLPFAVLSLHGTVATIGYVMAAATIPRLALLLVGGVWADRLPRRLVLLTTDVLQTALYTVVAATLLTGSASVQLLMAANALAGAASAFFRPAMSAIVPEVIGEEGRQQANALLSLSRSLASVVGPGLAGVVVAAAGSGWVFAADALSFAISGFCLSVLRVSPMAAAQRDTFWRDLAAGWKEFTSRRWYLVNLIVHGIWNFAISPFYVLGPVLAQQHLGGSRAWGTISAISAAGAIVGSMIVIRVRPRRPLVVANLALIPASAQLLALAGPFPLAAIAAAGFAGACGLAFLNDIWSTAVQRLMPGQVLARVTAYDWLISLTMMPLGYAVCGPVSAAIGVRPTLITASLLIAVPCALVVLLPGVRRVRGPALQR
jgi:MFS family permease